MSRWRANPESPVLYRRVRAGLVHNYMMLDAIPGLDCEHIKPIERPAYETALFLLADELVFRFKKGDVKGLSSNIGTQTALEYNDPNECLSLFDLPDLMRVDVVYTLNEYETMISDVLIVARDNERAAWSFSILPRQADIVPDPIGVDPKQPPAADTGLRIPPAEDAGNQEGDQVEDGRK